MHVVVALTSLLLEFYSAHHLGALSFLVFVEEAGIPIPVPGDTLVMLAGAVSHKTVDYDISVLALSSLAVFAGSSTLYGVTRRGGRPLLDKYGKYLHLNQRRLERMEHWFRRRGRLAIVFGRLIPGLRIPTTIIAGLSDVPYSVYAPTAAVAAVIWSLVYFFAGVLIRQEWGVVTSVVTGALDDLTDSMIWVRVVLFLLSLALSGGTWHLSRRIRRARQSRSGLLSVGGAVALPAVELTADADASAR
jgi:membrane protein DedA with SNARE-associated domain